MKLIIVAGKSGTGKTSVTEILAEKNGVDCIFVDSILDEYELGLQISSIFKAYKKNMDKTKFKRDRSDGKGDIHSLSSKGVKKSARKSLKKMMKKVNNRLGELIEEKKKNNPEYLVIDFLLPKLLYCWNYADERILVTKSIKKRIEHLRNRKRRLKGERAKAEGDVVIDEDNLKMRDALSYYKEYASELNEYDYIIENEGDKKELREMTNKVFSLIQKKEELAKIKIETKPELQTLVSARLDETTNELRKTRSSYERDRRRRHTFVIHKSSINKKETELAYGQEFELESK